MSSLPTLVIAHGGWHDPTCFSKVREQLESVGYKVHIPDQPSIGELAHVKTSHDTGAAIGAVIEECADRGEDIISIGHSSGGLYCCDGCRGLIKAQRHPEGKPGGVIAVGMIAAFIPPAFGKGAFAKITGFDTSWWDVDPEGTTLMPKDPQNHFYNDMPREEADYWAGRLRPMHMPVPHDFYEPWREVPLHYLICEDDLAQPLALQETMIECAREEGGVVHTERIAAGHSPFLSQPEATVRWIRRVAGEKVPMK